MLLIHQAINAIGELVLALTIPFLWWLIVTRRQVRFDRWLGFFPPAGSTHLADDRHRRLVYPLTGDPLPLIVDHGILATFVFNHRGFAGIPAALVYAIVGTSLPEEIFFRGFLLKRLQDRFGFLPANLTQAICFGGGPRPLAGGRRELAGHPDHRPNRNGDWLLPGLAQRTP